MNLLLGDCLERLKTLPDNSVDSVVTDPPYGLAFMGKKWDYDVPSVDIWREVFRVLKPGGHLLSFGGTRTYHRMVVNIEDAGFEIRDQLMWIYGQGFPKSLDISKAIDKAAGAEREVVGRSHDKKYTANAVTAGASIGGTQGGHNHKSVFDITAPATPEAEQWQGWGTALKPANEPIVLARKPVEGTIAANVLKYGTGGLNIDRSRIETSDKLKAQSNPNIRNGKFNGGYDGRDFENFTPSPLGRFPSNVLLDEAAAEMLDAQSGERPSRGGNPKQNESESGFQGGWHGGNEKIVRNDSGGASRFFYVAKASKAERGSFNGHPTVKPVKLMQYLVRLITPPGGVCLDPFMGSGTTGVACAKEGFEFIGIEREQQYFEIAKKRVRSGAASADVLSEEQIVLQLEA